MFKTVLSNERCLAFMKIPKATGICWICSLAKTSENWPIFKVLTNDLLKALYTQRGNDQKSNGVSIRFLFLTQAEFIHPKNKIFFKVVSPYEILYFFPWGYVCLECFGKSCYGTIFASHSIV